MTYEHCRDRGHAWLLPKELPRGKAVTGIPRSGYLIDGDAVERVLVCLRCSTQRHELFSRRGIRTRGARYRYPDGYLLRGEGRRGRDEFRALAVKAALKAMRGGKR